MKKFYAGTTQGVSATTIKATDLLAIAITKDTTVEEITEATTGLKVLELINNALAESRAAYAITSPFQLVKETVARVLQSKLNERINALVALVEDEGDVFALDTYVEEGRISREVVEYVADLYDANQVNKDAVPVEVLPMVIEKGCNLTEEQVLAMMGTRGLFVGAPCHVPVGEAFVLGFKATSHGVMVVVAVDGNTQPLTYMATGVKGKEENKTNQTMEVIQMTTNNNKSVTATTQTTKNEEVNAPMTTTPKTSAPSLTFVPAVTDKDARAAVDQAVAGQENWELTAEERAVLAEQQLQNDLAAFAAKQGAKSEAGAVVANSSAAQALKAFTGVPATKQPAATSTAPVLNNTNAAAPIVAPVAQVRTNNQPTKTIRGGNVQMTNSTVNTQGAAAQTQGAVRQGSAAFGGSQVVSGRQGSTPSLALNGMAVGASTPALAGWDGINAAMNLIQVDEYVGRNGNGNRDFVWYLEEAVKYEGQIMTVAELQAAGMKNESIGITDIKFYSPASVAGLWNREAADNDFMYVEVFFGATSYEFRIKRGSNERQGVQRPYIFSTNITRKQANSGIWSCEYVAGRRADKLQVVVQADGVVREARTEWNNTTREREIVAADLPFVQEVGGATWVNQGLYGTKVGQQVFIQVMMMMDEVSGLKAARDSK